MQLPSENGVAQDLRQQLVVQNTFLDLSGGVSLALRSTGGVAQVFPERRALVPWKGFPELEVAFPFKTCS